MQEVERYERKQVLAIGGTEIKIAVPMANSDADIEAGTILGQVTASKINVSDRERDFSYRAKSDN
jgi:hypothetical protein